MLPQAETFGGSLLLNLPSIVTDLNISKFLDEAGALLLNRIRQRFLDETDPDGNPWIPSKAGQRRRALGSTGTLWETGKLFRSIQLRAVGENQRDIYTNVEDDRGAPYGIFMQFGTDILPPRPFLGISEEDADLIEALLVKRIEAKI